MVGHGKRRARHDESGKALGLLVLLPGRHDLVHESDAMRFGRIDELAGQHQLPGLVQPHAHRQQLRCAARDRHAGIAFGKSEPGVFGGDDQVRIDRDFESAAHGKPPDRSNHDLPRHADDPRDGLETLGNVFHDVENRVNLAGLDLRILLERDLQILAGAEGISDARDDDRLDLRIVRCLAQRTHERPELFRAQRIQNLGPIESDPGDFVLHLIQQLGHCSCFSPLSFVRQCRGYAQLPDHSPLSCHLRRESFSRIEEHQKGIQIVHVVPPLLLGGHFP